jgi:hypothetical protein
MDNIKLEDLDTESLIELMEIFEGMKEELDIEKEVDTDE